MTKPTPDDEYIKSQVTKEMEDAKALAKTFDLEEIKSGEWFLKILQHVVRTHNRNARATYFQKKYPGLPPDDIADILISVVVRYATVAGAVAGVASTANQFVVASTAGLSTPLFLGSLLAEMLYLAQIQMRLVLDLSVVYDLQLDPDDPEDVLMIFGYALGVAPADLIGRGLRIATEASTKVAVKKYISKGTLKTIQDFARRLGFKILQRTILKYAVPVASAAVGSSYNYASTKSVGKIAKAHLKNRGKMTEDLRILVSRQHTYDIVFPAAVKYIAQVDGQFSDQEKELYKSMVSCMSFDEHTQKEFQKLTAKEENILEAIGKLEDEEVRSNLMETLVLMSIYDGELAEKERKFLIKAAERLNVPLDIAEIEQRTQDYQIIVQKNVFEKTAVFTGEAAAKAIDAAGQLANEVKNSAVGASEKVKTMFDRVDTSKIKNLKIPSLSKKSTKTKSKKANEDLSLYESSLTCEQPEVAEKNCVSCNKLIPVDFSFCPYCGAPLDSSE